MASSMLACKGTAAGFLTPRTRDQSLAKRTLGSCPSLVGRSSYVKTSSVGLRCETLSAACRWRGAECVSFGPKTGSHWREEQGLRLENRRFVCNAATAAGTFCVPEDESQQSNGRTVVNFLQRIAALRSLPVLVLGLGVMLSLRPGHALANVTEEVFSPQGKGLLASAWAGLVAGCLHTLTGPDHLAALAPLCIGRSRIQSAAVGALWGCGHDAGQIIFGLVFLTLKDRLHIELIRTWASRVVGLTLVTIGCVGIYESQVPLEVLAEEAGLSGGEPQVRRKNDSKSATTFATGVVYGLQPDALLMILPALALPSKVTGAAFLVMFLLGTVLAMGSYTLFISSCSHALQKRLPGITKNLTLGSSIIAIALGLALVASELFGLNIF